MILKLNFRAFVMAAFSAAFGAVLQARAGVQETPIAQPDVSATSSGLALLDDFNQKRSKLEDKGITLAGIYTGEVFGNPVGGFKQGAIYEDLIELDLTLDLKKMCGWDGSFHASAYYPMGSSLTQNDTHDLFGVSSIDAYDTPHLFELWYEQKAFEEKLSVRIGQLAADTEFFVSNAAANFLNSTYGWPAILASNAPTPNYPYAAPGVRLRVDPDDHWSFLGAVFAGNPAPDRIGDPNPNRVPDQSKPGTRSGV
jgi:porin